MQFARFILAGTINTIVGYGVYLLLLRPFDYLTAYAAAYVTGVLVSYWLNSVFVFRQPMSWRGLVRFPLVYVFQFVLTASLLWLLVDMLGVGADIALLGAIAVSIPATFLAARFMIVPRRLQ